MIIEKVLRRVKIDFNLIIDFIEFLDSWSHTNNFILCLLRAKFRFSYFLDYLLYCAHDNNQYIGANIEESDTYHGPANWVLERDIVIQEIWVQVQVVGTREDATLIEDVKMVQEWVFEGTDSQQVGDHAKCAQNTKDNLKGRIGLQEKREEADQ